VPIFRAEYTALEVVGSNLYGGGVGGLDVFDLVDEANPVPVGDVALSGWVRDLAVAGHILYAAADTNTAILDISDPVHPQPLGTLASSGRSLARVGNRLYVGTVNGSLDLYDLANPAQPALLGSLAFGPGRVEDVDVAGSVVFAAHNQFGVRVVDVSDPASPHLIGGFSTPNPLTTAIAGSQLYVGGFNGFGVQILDASDPTQLHQVGAFDRTPNVRELEIRDGRLYATNGLLYVLELVSPTAPATLGAVFPSGPTFALSAAGVAYTSSTFSYTPSLLAIDFGPEYAPPLSVELDVRPGDPWNRVLLSRPVSLLVGLLGSASLDAGQIDPYGLAFGPRGTPAQNSVPASLNGDEHEDLLAAFWTLDSGIAFGDTEVCLTGRLVSGRRLQGCDFINTHVGCGPGWQLALVVPLCIPLTRLARRTRRARGDARA